MWGGGGSSSDSVSSSTTTTDDKSRVSYGTIVDAKIDGVRYESTSYSGTSSDGGQFEFAQDEAVKFYVGNILIGEVSKVPDDKLVFLQDILSLPRTTINDKVLALATFIQSLDTVPNNDSLIKIGDHASKFTQNQLNFNSIDDVSQLLLSKNIAVKDSDKVKEHLIALLKSYGYTPNTTIGADINSNTLNFLSSPQNGRTDIEAYSNIVLNFSNNIKSVISDKILLSINSKGTNLLSKSITFNNKSLTINPDNNLTAGQTYYVIMESNCVADDLNNSLSERSVVTFTVKKSNSPTFVSSTQKNKTNVSVNSNIVLEFSEKLKSIDSSKIVLARDIDGNNSIAKLATLNGKNVVINPDVNLSTSTKYYVLIRAGAVTDNDDNALTQEANFSFTTSSSSTPVTTGWIEYEGTEYLALQDSNVSKGLGEQTCQTNGGTLADSDKIGVTNITKFAQALYLTHYDSDYLMKNGYYISAKFSPSHSAWGRSGPFPAANDEVYVICEKSATGSTDNTPPELVNANPPTVNANSVSVNTSITLTFDENLKTINVNRFILSTDVNANNKISTTTSRTGKVVTMVPNSSLSPNTTYYVHIKSGCATDNAGNAYASNAYYKFKTANSTTPSSDWTAVSGINGYTFKRFDNVVTYSSAVSKCQIEGGSLATRTDVGVNTNNTNTENDNLANMITALSLSKGDKYWYSSGGYNYTVSYDNASDKWKPKNTFNGSAKYICKKANSTGGSSGVPSGFTEYSNGYYKIGEANLYWAKALQLCQNLGNGITLLPKAQADVLLQNATFKNSLKKNILGSVSNHWIAENNASYGYIIKQTWTSSPIEIDIAGKNSGAQPAYVCYKPKASAASVGTLHDALVIGATYKSGSFNGTTNEKGEFNFISGEKVEFFAGAVKIGVVQTVPDDKKVFLQDMVGVNRENVNNEKVIKIATFLQSLDSQEANTSVVDLRNNVSAFADDNVDLNASDVNVTTLLNNNGISDVVSEDDVKNHIKTSLNANSISADTTAPTLTSALTNPSPSATLNVKSDEELLSSSITNENIKLYQGANELSVNVSLDATKKIINIKPTSTLSSSITYTIKIANVSDENENKVSKNIDFTTADVDSPSINTATSTPANGTTNVALDSDLALHVSEIVTVDNSKIKLYKVDGNASIDITVSGSNSKVITISPNNDLDSQKEYKLIVSSDALRDTSLNALGSDFTISFTTEDKIDPTLSESAISLHPDTLEYKITASEDLNQSSVNTTNITLTQSSNPVAINLSYAKKVITIKPTSSLASLTDYVLTLQNIEDLSANKAANKTINFTTKDSNAPTIVGNSISASISAVAIDENVIITVSEDIKSANITTANITLVNSDTNASVAIAVSYADKNITINPDDNLDSTTNYKLVISANTLEDLSGNKYTSEYDLAFTTKDEKKPSFVSSSPANEAINVATDTEFAINFSENVKILNSTSIVLSLSDDGSNPVTDGIVATLDKNTSKVKITLQKDNILFNTDYYIIIPTTAIADTSNNQLESKISIKFTTKAEDWKTVSGISGYTFKKFYESQISSSDAMSNCVNVGGELISKENLDVNQYNNGFNDTTKINSLVSALNLDVKKAFWFKKANGSTSAVYKSYGYWRFQTPYNAYYICEKQVLTADLKSSNVYVSKSIIVEFSKAVDSTTITDQSVSLVAKGESTNLLVSGDLSINDKILTITPNPDLTEGTTYTLTLDKSIIKDSGNEALIGTNSFEFTAKPASNCPENFVEYPTGSGKCYSVAKEKSSYYSSKCTVGKAPTYSEIGAIYQAVGSDEFDSGFATTLGLKKDGSIYLLAKESYNRWRLKYENGSQGNNWYLNKTTSSGYQICYIEQTSASGGSTEWKSFNGKKLVIINDLKTKSELSGICEAKGGVLAEQNVIGGNGMFANYDNFISEFSLDTSKQYWFHYKDNWDDYNTYLYNSPSNGNSWAKKSKYSINDADKAYPICQKD